MTWVTAKKIAERTNKHLSTIEKAAMAKKANVRYAKGRGRGGKTMMIALETLPVHIQNLFTGTIIEPKDLMSFTAKQREAADYKAYIVEEYRRSGLSPADYVAQYNRTNQSDPLNTDRLFRWQRKYLAGGRSVSALVDRRGGHNRGTSTITSDAWEYFHSLYMTQQRLSIQRCYEFTSLNLMFRWT